MTQDESHSMLERAKALFVDQCAQGPVDIEELCREHPDLQAQLRRLDQNYRDAESALAQVLADDTGDSEELRGQLARRLSELESPRSSENYDAKREIARGGMSCVLEVWDQRLRRNVAMKRLPLAGRGVPVDAVERRRLTRFLEEAQVTGQLGHPSVLAIHDLGIDAAGRPFFTMPLVQGKTFGEVVEYVHKGEEGWSMARALSILVRVCEAVAFAHSRGVVHRDLKPANILVGQFGEAYVVDWGLAKVAGCDAEVIKAENFTLEERSSDDEVASLRRPSAGSSDAMFTLDGEVIGTPSYMAPEQAAGRLDAIGAHTDVYAAGAVLYQLLTGCRPYDLPVPLTKTLTTTHLQRRT